MVERRKTRKLVETWLEQGDGETPPAAAILGYLRELAEAEATASSALHGAIAAILAKPPRDRGVEGSQIADAIGLSRQQLYQINRNISGSLRERRQAEGGHSESEAQTPA